ncbi:hypothetical protein C8F01DRAFT_1087362 [Mycena amicta]|nr:hypothetical protein C8F01DRAFT_1087362 [Mycena amicta]
MKHNFTALVALVAALAVVVSAAPAVHAKQLYSLLELMNVKRRPPAEARSAEVSAHVFICTDINFAGDCTNYGFNNGQCSNFPGIDLYRGLAGLQHPPAWNQRCYQLGALLPAVNAKFSMKVEFG